MPTKSPPVGGVVAALAPVLRRGLPITAATADPVLVGLRGVGARAVDPGELDSRIAALDGVLRGLLARFPDARYASAARALFGLAPARTGMTLTVRREVAASACGHEVHHFRKRVEPRLLIQLATALRADAERFTRVQRAAPRLAPVTGRERVGADPFAWEVAEQEEALTRVWAAIYALRAELLAIERLISLDLDDQQVIIHAVSAAWRWALASNAAHAYVAAFPNPDIRDASASGDSDPGAGSAAGSEAAELVGLAGWVPTLTDTQRRLLRAAALGDASRARFVAALHDQVELGTTWVTGFLDRPLDAGLSTGLGTGTDLRSMPASPARPSPAAVRSPREESR